MEDDGTVELERERKLRGEELAHLGRNRLLLQPVEPDLAHAEPRIRRELFAKPLANAPGTFGNHSTIPQLKGIARGASAPRLPRVNADKVATDQELADGRVAAADVAMRVGHIRMRSDSAFSSFLSPLWFSNTIGSCP